MHTVIRPIIYGSVSQCIWKNKENYYYNWMVYIRGEQNEDLSAFIDKVVFILHDSFSNNVRTIDKHPFVLEESGWGQFEILVKIHFKGEYSNMTVGFPHLLKVSKVLLASSTLPKRTRRPY